MLEASRSSAMELAPQLLFTPPESGTYVFDVGTLLDGGEATGNYT